MVLLGVRNWLENHEELELLLPETTLKIKMAEMCDLNGILVKQVHNEARVWLPMAEVVPSGAVLRRKARNLSV